MSRATNFSAGPCALPDEVMIRAQAELLNYRGEGASVMEITHRGETFQAIHDEAESLLRELLNAPKNYRVLFLQGGATGQFAAIPMNLLRGEKKASYAITGHWSEKAAAEASLYCEAQIAADNRPDSRAIPKDWHIDEDAAYLHYADNETVHGVEFSAPPQTNLPLVGDVSSNILSRKIEVADFALLYAGAQKNLGPSGVTIVVVREDLIGDAMPQTPRVFDFRAQADDCSMINTPPTFQIYMVGLVLQWLKEKGGVAAMEKQNAEKSRALYEFIDGGEFYRNPVAAESRSRMNVPFFLRDDSLTDKFVAESTQAGLIGLKGHKILGGLRASIYNAIPQAGVDALLNFMRDFEKKNG